MPEEIPSNDNHFQLPGGGIVKVAILTLVILLVERRLGQAISWLALLEAAARAAPADAQTQFNVAVGLQSVGRLDDAAEHYRAALALDDRDADAHTNLGVLLCERHRYPEAKKHFLRAVEINPEHVKAYVNLGTLCVETREYADAIKYSQRALDLDPHLPNCRENIEVARRALGREH